MRGRRRIVIRPAEPADAEALLRLARLAGRPRPAGPALVAEADGAVLAARGADGLVVADPFAATADLRALLDVRAAQLAG